jgi:methylenetetrahydrofolate--tRNA-(uracil-5-)-methyltransferase
MGLLAGRFAAAERLGQVPVPPPVTTAMGALIGHVTGGHIATEDGGRRSFQPMNVKFGLFPPVEIVRGPDAPRMRGKDKAIARKHAWTARALADLSAWLGRETASAA